MPMAKRKTTTAMARREPDQNKVSASWLGIFRSVEGGWVGAAFFMPTILATAEPEICDRRHIPPSHFSSMAERAANCTGFGKKSFMPASRQRMSSPFMALAVRAITGTF